MDSFSLTEEYKGRVVDRITMSLDEIEIIFIDGSSLTFVVPDGHIAQEVCKK